MKIFKKWWFWLLIIIIVVIAASSGDDENEGAKKVDEDTNSSQVEKQENTEKKDQEKAVATEFAVGEAVELGDNILKVTKFEKSAGSEYDKPKSGKEFVIVHVEISNKGDENISYNPYDFKMLNSQGQLEDNAFTTIDSDTSLNSGELAPNGTVTGTLAFEEPANDQGLQLQYSPSFWSDKTIKINIK